MKLSELQITNYRSISDSTAFSVSNVTCLVGKNESGKTNILRCLERLNSVDPKVKKQYDEDMDWPRNSESQPTGDAKVIVSTWSLEPFEIEALEDSLGEGCLASQNITLTTNFAGKSAWDIKLDEDKVRTFLLENSGVPVTHQKKVASVPLDRLVKEIDEKHSSVASLKSLADELRKFRDGRPILKAIDLLDLPEMLYFANYDRLGGRISVEELLAKKQRADLSREHQLFLMFLDYAGVKPEELQNPKTAEAHISKLERAQNRITAKIFKYWTQNRDLEVRFEALPGRSQDPAPFNNGTVFHTRIYNRLHKMTVPFDERSAGFTWFFSFLVQFTQIREKHDSLMILLDEPGGSLHGMAQQDLLRFIEEELKPHHQVLYTTHSPFMVPPANLERVRVVEDVVEDGKHGDRISHGTKVSSDFLSVTKDTRFPLQGALGYEITQTLFIGPYSLLVEGPGDILFIQAAARALGSQNRPKLDSRWTPCPAGGVNKVFAFVSLFAGNAMKAAVFVDLANGVGGNRKELEALKSSKILESSRIFTAADFTGLPESDIEDMWGDDGYLMIVNHAFNLPAPITAADLAATNEKSTRVVKRVEAWFRAQASVPNFDHYRPAEFLILNPAFISQNIAAFESALNRFEALFNKLNGLL